MVVLFAAQARGGAAWTDIPKIYKYFRSPTTVRGAPGHRGAVQRVGVAGLRGVSDSRFGRWPRCKSKSGPWGVRATAKTSIRYNTSRRSAVEAQPLVMRAESSCAPSSGVALADATRTRSEFARASRSALRSSSSCDRLGDTDHHTSHITYTTGPQQPPTCAPLPMPHVVPLVAVR